MTFFRFLYRSKAESRELRAVCISAAKSIGRGLQGIERLMRLILRQPGRKAAVAGMLLSVVLLAACEASGQMDTQPRVMTHFLPAVLSRMGGRRARRYPERCLITAIYRPTAR